MYKLDKEISDLLIHYCLLKKKCQKLDKRPSQNYSFDADFDNTERRFSHSYKIPDFLEECKDLRSRKKDEIIENYFKIDFIYSKMQNVSLMFYKYVIELGKEIYNKKRHKYLATIGNNKSKNINNNFDSKIFDRVSKSDLIRNSPKLTNTSLTEDNKFQSGFEITDASIKMSSNILSLENNISKQGLSSKNGNNHLIVKIGHLIINCGKIFEDSPQNNELSYNSILDEDIYTIKDEILQSKSKQINKENYKKIINYTLSSNNMNQNSPQKKNNQNTTTLNRQSKSKKDFSRFFDIDHKIQIEKTHLNDIKVNNLKNSDFIFNVKEEEIDYIKDEEEKDHRNKSINHG